MKLLRIIESVLASDLAISLEDKFPDVLAVGRQVVVSQERQTKLPCGEFGPELRAVMAGRTLCLVGAVGLDFAFDSLCDIHHPVNSEHCQVAPMVVLLPNTMGLNSGGKVLGVI